MKVEWTSAAKADLVDIFDYILQENPQAAADVLDRIAHSAMQLVDHPGMGRPGRVEETRELIIADLPYILPYLTGGDRVTIVRVLHTATQWPSRFSSKDGAEK